MRLSRLSAVMLCGALAAGCGDNDGNGDDDGSSACDEVDSAHCEEIAGGDVARLQEVANSLENDTTILLGAGTFAMTNGLTIRASGIHIIGKGIDQTTLDFGPTTTQVNGVDVVGDDFLVEGLTVLDAPKDGIRVEDSDGVVFRKIRATWSTPSDPGNGAYGIYPVKSKNVLVEDSRAENASDAGLYVGQCQYAIVRNNVVTGNVAGLEIENTQYADVYGNTAEDNTGGIVVFDLPGNPVIGRDIRLRDNIIRNNNHVNFAPGGTVASIPVGTGTFAMASRRVEITGNTYANNDTGDIAIISGLAIEGDRTKWALDTSTLIGKWDDLALMPGGDGKVTNFRSENIVIANNTHSGSGTKPDQEDPLMLGVLLKIMYGTDPVDNILYDTIGEGSFDPADAAQNTNDNHLCLGGNTGGTFASMDLLPKLGGGAFEEFFRPEAPFAPFECTTLNGGAVAPVTLPQ
jgi:parallel beta-helix repeat protein